MNILLQLILPEYVFHALFTVLFLIAGEFLTVLLNLPLDAFHVMKYMNRWVERSINQNQLFLIVGGRIIRISSMMLQARHEWSRHLRSDHNIEC